VADVSARPATPADLPRVVPALAAAFAGDPPLSHLLPDPSRRRARLERYFAALLPHLYLRLGEIWVTAEPVDPAAHGRGTGSALLAPVLERCDRVGAGAYLNAGSPRSRELYRRHGFEVTEEFSLPFEGPPLWRMWRPPR
jgi:GNAT superfamily N-acetyltransferase